MRKTIKLMSGVLALAMCFSAMPTAVFAAEQTDQTLTANDTASVEVTISTPSQFNVQIPKKLVLTGLGATADAAIPYTYKVQGSIAGNEQVRVVPDATITMQQEGKADNTGTITQEKQIWSCADFEALNGSNAAEIVWSEATSGNILVENMSAGEWNGTFNFNIELGVHVCTPNSDDGDCTTAVKCSGCGAVITAAQAEHSITGSDLTCSNDGCKKTAREFEITPENRYLVGYTVETTDLVIPETFYSGNTLYKVTSIGYSAFMEEPGSDTGHNLTSVVIPDSVTNIGNSAFAMCYNLSSVNIPAGVTNIGSSAFIGTAITSITIPDSVTSIGNQAFSITNITSITIPDGITLIDMGMFAECVHLESITIPDSVTSIETEAFKNCRNLINITIPTSVTKIADYAFESCSSLTSFTYNGTMEQWNAITKEKTEYSAWNNNTGEYTIHCTDGCLDKSENPIECSCADHITE